MSDSSSDAKRLQSAIDRHTHGEGKSSVVDIEAAAVEFSQPYRTRISELEAEHAASWEAFEKEVLAAIGSDVIGHVVDPGSDIPGMIRKLHERYQAQIWREDLQRIELAEQLKTYKRIANMKRTSNNRGD